MSEKAKSGKTKVIRKFVQEPSGGLLAKITIAKFRDKRGALGPLLQQGLSLTALPREPYQVIEEILPIDLLDVFLNEGINEIWSLVAGDGSAVAYDNTYARIGVGNGTASEDASQTALQGGSTAFKAMDGGYPTYGTAQKIVFRSTFVSGEAEFAWEEFTVDNGATRNKNLHRKVTSKGTKGAGETWVCQIELSLS